MENDCEQMGCPFCKHGKCKKWGDGWCKLTNSTWAAAWGEK